MPKDDAYKKAEQKIAEALEAGVSELDLSNMDITELPDTLGQLFQLKALILYGNQLATLPESLKELDQLTHLDLSSNQLTALPDSLGQLTQLTSLDLSRNQLTTLPASLRKSTNLKRLDIFHNNFAILPEWLGDLKNLTDLIINDNQIVDLPDSVGNIIGLGRLFLGAPAGGNPLHKLPDAIRQLHQLHTLYVAKCELNTLPGWILELENLEFLNLDGNPLNPALQSAYDQGLDAVKAYLRSLEQNAEPLYEAKLILVGEGEVGKTCLMDALLDKPWEEHPSTHGIEIQKVKVTDAKTKNEITLNGWDFGGQRVYRPTHQLFFSAPAVYLVVWKPREGSQAGQVKEWIQLVKRREPSAKILVVATHGGPKQRLPDIDRQDLWDSFGKETIIDFFHVESKPDKKGNRRGIKELKKAIARVAAELPEMGSAYPKNWQGVREALVKTRKAYLPLEDVLKICRKQKLDDEQAQLFIAIEHRLGHLIHYQHDPVLSDIVILKPDWLATAISFVLDDEETRRNKGLVHLSRLCLLWNDPKRSKTNRYPQSLHQIFVRLMERFDLCYRVAGVSANDDKDPGYLIAQLVPDIKLNPITGWADYPKDGNSIQTQICRIVDKQSGQSANAEGLFYQLIVRLHKYSLGRSNYDKSVHWQKGLVLDNNYNGRAFLEHKVNDIQITVSAAYPQGFLTILTDEVRFLVESFWEGLRCEITVPCLNPTSCKGLFEVSKLIENKKQGRPEQPCSVCNYWQSIDQLLSNAPAAAQPISIEVLEKQFASIQGKLDVVDTNTQRILSQIDKTYTDLLKVLTDEAREGPRLFSLIPVKRSGFNPKEWTSEKFKLILWCEHIRLPLPVINGKDSTKGVYELELTRDWFRKSAPLLKLMTGALSLALPVVASGLPLVIDKAAYEVFKDSIGFGKNVIDATLKASDISEAWKDKGSSVDLTQGVGIRAEHSALRELQAFLKEKDPGFGGLVRVTNRRQEFLWVHEKFTSEY